MPLPRFSKLSAEKQTEILQAATMEIAEHGIEGASIASIVERVGLSKSAVYYYFADKRDLLDTVLAHNLEEALSIVDEIASKDMDRDFWGVLTAMKERIILHFAGRPEARKVWQLALGTSTSDSPPTLPSTNSNIREIWLSYIQIGQSAGAVRKDLPNEFLVDLVLAFDGVSQRHSIAECGDLPIAPDSAAALAARSIDILRRVLSPTVETAS